VIPGSRQEKQQKKYQRVEAKDNFWKFFPKTKRSPSFVNLIFK
jgi:hypothetical protein